MRNKILAIVFAAALLVAMAVPLFGDGGLAYAQDEDAQGVENVQDPGEQEPPNFVLEDDQGVDVPLPDCVVKVCEDH